MTGGQISPRTAFGRNDRVKMVEMTGGCAFRFLHALTLGRNDSGEVGLIGEDFSTTVEMTGGQISPLANARSK